MSMDTLVLTEKQIICLGPESNPAARERFSTGISNEIWHAEAAAAAANYELTLQ